MKRTILCVSLLALSLTACKNDAKSNDEATAEERTEQTKEANTENLPLAFNSDEGSLDMPFKSQTISILLKSFAFTAFISFLINFNLFFDFNFFLFFLSHEK